MSQPPQGPPPGYAGPPHGATPNAPTQSLPIPGHAPQAGPQGPHQGAPQGPPPGPPPGYPTGQFGPDPGSFGPVGLHGAGPGPSGAPAKAATGVWVLGLVSLAATVVGLSVEENGHNAWDSVHAWGGLAILGALLTLAPVLHATLNLSPQRAWQTAACGAAALGLFWVLFVLPAAGSNTSLVTTVGAAAGIIAVWIAPGRPTATGPEAAGGPQTGTGPQGHSW